MNLAHATGAQIRALCRSGQFDGPTAGLALGYAQTNLVILRRGSTYGKVEPWTLRVKGGQSKSRKVEIRAAGARSLHEVSRVSPPDLSSLPEETKDVVEAFERFCRLNPRPCPLLEVTLPGVPEARKLAPGSDLRTDLPRYRIIREGTTTDRPNSIVPYWTDDSVAYLIGCSFTFETALLAAGLPVRHIEERHNVPMFRTNIPCMPAPPFEGPLVVSMRPMTPEQAEKAARITAEFPSAHGAPVHVGDPAALGIRDIRHPDYGDPVTIHPDERPVFWACGVTPMEVILRARLDWAITHEPGHMFVTDVLDPSLRQMTAAH
jgi:uncharacterized protein YcsI (UPF0317 family)